MNLMDLRIDPYSKHVLERLEIRLDPNQPQIYENSITTQSGVWRRRWRRDFLKMCKSLIDLWIVIEFMIWEDRCEDLPLGFLRIWLILKRFNPYKQCSSSSSSLKLQGPSMEILMKLGELGRVLWDLGISFSILL